MNWLEQLLPHALVHALGWTLVHSLWQGAVVALALAGLLLLLRKHSAEVRYRTAALGLVVLLSLAAITFVRYFAAAQAKQARAVAGFVVGDIAGMKADGMSPAEAPAVLDDAFGEAAVASSFGRDAVAPTTGLRAWLVYFDQNIPVLVAAWLLGLLAMTLRLLGGLAYVQRLRRYRVQPLATEWQERLASLATRAGLTQPVELLESALVRVPVVVGHLKPVILLPLGTVTGLSTTYLEAILAHELAHVQRRDYLMNLVQSVAETVLFYHPAVWFITACLRTERENCCDDAATALVGGNPLTVARALAALAELSVAPEPASRLAMSALGPDGSVLGRIRRLVQGRTAPTFTEGFMAACVVLGGLVLLTSAVALADPRPASEPEAGSGALSRLPFLASEPDTTRKKPDIASEFVIPEAELLEPLAYENVLATEADMAIEEAEEVTAIESEVAFTTSDDDDKKKKRRKAGQQLVVVQEPRRGRTGTVVIEKDKKGRLTALTVDGQPVATGADSGKRGKKAAQQIEVIRVPASNRTIWSGSSANGFGFKHNTGQTFTFSGPGLSAAEISRMQREAERATADASQQLRNADRWENRWQTEFFRKPNGLTYMKIVPRLKALEGAERSLRSSLQDLNLNDEQRRHITEQLSLVRKQKEEVRRLANTQQPGMHSEFWEQSQGKQEGETDQREIEAEMRRHNAEMRRLEGDMRRHESEMRRHEAELRNESRRQEDNEAEEVLRRELRKDGLIEDADNFRFSLSSTSLTVNGKKQSAAMRDKYLKLIEVQRGRKLQGKSTYVINRQSSSSTSYSDMPAPPAPPAPPRAPLAPRAPRAPQAPAAPDAPMAPDGPDAPMPPAPPAPPTFDTDQIRAELRKDGVLEAKEKAFQFELNNSGLTVNGKKQSAALAEKYRQMLDVPATTSSKGSKTTRNVQISVNE